MAKQQTQTSREPTRKQLALSRREKEQLRFIYVGLGVVGGLILLVLAFGLYQTYVVEPGSPVATVNGVEISTGEYQNRVRYERFLLEDQYQQIRQQAAMLAEPGNEQLAQFLASQYEQYAGQLFQMWSAADRQALDDMIEEVLVREEAQKRGLETAPEEVNEEINQYLAARAGGLTTKAATETATARAEASATAALWTPTPTFTPSPTITLTEEITQPTATPANTPTPAPTPTLNILKEDALQTEYTNWLATLANQVGLSEAQYRQIAEVSVLREKLQEALGEEVPRSAEQAHARHILVETEEEIQEVVERLEKGEDFAELAQELSKDPSSAPEGGDLGFVPRGSFVGPVDEAVFSLPLGQVSDPIQSDFGWHIIEVLEREERELAPQDYSRSQNQAYTDWLSEARTAATIQDFWSTDKSPEADPSIFQTPLAPVTQ